MKKIDIHLNKSQNFTQQHDQVKKGYFLIMSDTMLFWHISHNSNITLKILSCQYLHMAQLHVNKQKKDII